MNKEEMCMYVPGSTTIIDTMNDDGLSTCFSETPAQVAERNPGAVLMPFAAAVGHIREAMAAKYNQPPLPITEERYEYLLNVLPPECFTGSAWRMSEYMEGPYTLHVAQVGGRYWSAIRKAGPGSVRAFCEECRGMLANNKSKEEVTA